MKKHFLFFMSIMLSFGLLYGIGSNSASAATPVLDARVKVIELVKNSDNSFYVSYQILKDLESYESASVVGAFPAQYRGSFSGVGITLNKKKGTYYQKINAPSSGAYGWLSFSVSYFASGGTQGYSETKYITKKLAAPADSVKFHTVTASQASLEWIVYDVAPGLAIWLSNLDPKIKVAVSAAYSAFQYLSGFSDAINTSLVFKATAGNYVKTEVKTDSTGKVTTSVYYYTSKESYTKNVAPIYSYSRSYTYPT